MWSLQQQSLLNAMGYTIYARPSAKPSNLRPELADVPVASIGAQDSTLFKAVMRAAQGKDISPLGIDLNALRTSPHAKRALWPQLRRIIKS